MTHNNKNEQGVLSVIVPCYNAGPLIKRCVSSIIEQTYSPLEIILIDDGSTDNTSALCNSLAVTDKRIRVIHQKNQGSSITRENGLKVASGEYVTFVDADDWIHERMYETMVGGLEKENADIAICGVCDAYDGSTPPPSHRIETQKGRYDQ